MSDTMKSRIRQFVIYVILPLFLIAMTYMIDRKIRCTDNGLTRNEALKIAHKKLKIQFRNHPLLSNFILVREQFDNKSWMFTFESNDCTADITIDKCGVADVGGLSKGCDMQVQESQIK